MSVKIVKKGQSRLDLLVGSPFEDLPVVQDGRTEVANLDVRFCPFLVKVQNGRLQMDSCGNNTLVSMTRKAFNGA